jgi:uncharacterized delta-60 repeat protein
MLASGRLLAFAAVSVLALVFGGSARGQENWSAVTSPTDRNLWSVCYGGGQFVAVGEGGTILTSPDGLAWTRRNSGNTLWLVGACHGNGLFVVVGDQGTILTSGDGVTWTTRRSGGTRINAVAYGNGFFLAVDEGGGSWRSFDGVSWTGSSTHWGGTQLRGIVHVPPAFVVTGASGRIQVTNDGVAWTTRPIDTTAFIESIAYGRGLYVVLGAANLTYTSRDTVNWTPQQNAPAYFHGVGYFNDQFVGATDKGFIVTSTDGTSWTTRSTGSTQLLIAVANSDSIGVVVGFGGTILRSVATPRAPSIIEHPKSFVEALGSNVLFEVGALGSKPLEYQWFLNGNPIVGATGETLLLKNIQQAQSGRYSATARNSFGFVSSNAGVLATIPAQPPVTSIIDANFSASPPPTTPPKAIAEQSDGKIVIGGDFIYLVNGAPQLGIARLQANGLLDESFKVGRGIDGANASIEAIAIQSDGRILIAGLFSSIAGVSRTNIARLTSAGEVDPSFTPPTSIAPGVNKIVVQPDGKILYLAGSAIGRLNSDGSRDAAFSTSLIATVAISEFAMSRSSGRIVVLSGGSLRAFTSAGVPDASFTSVAVSSSMFFGQGRLALLEIVSEDKVVYGGGWAITGGRFEIARVNSDGSLDPTFNRIGSSLYYSGVSLSLDSSQRILVSVSPGTRGGAGGLIRYDQNGRIDSTFRFNATIDPLYTWFRAFPISGDRLILSGTFTTVDGVRRSTLARTVASNAGLSNPPKVSPQVPQFAFVNAGSSVEIDLSPAGTPPFQFVYAVGGSGADAGTFSGGKFVVANAQSGGVYTIRIINAAGEYTHHFTLSVKQVAPSIINSPLNQSVDSGRFAVFNVSSIGTDPRSYQWFLDNTPIPAPSGIGFDLPFGVNSPTLTIPKVSQRNAGTYTVVIRNSLGTATASARLTVDDTSRLANLSTRGQTAPGENVLIVGFVVSGPSAKTVLLRGIGPALGEFGLTGTVPNPVLSLFDSGGAKIAENDNWAGSGTLSAAFANLGAFPLTPNSLDSALQRTLEPGRYTAQLTDATGGTGIGLVEVYENDLTSSRLVNLSTRVLVGAGASLAIPGIVVRGPVAQRLLIRAVGPSLSSFGVRSGLVDPILSIVNSVGEPIGGNDDWSGASNAGEVASVAARVGAFPLPAGSKDAAILVSLAPGNYTALVSGAGESSGIALVEVYEVP